MSGDLPSDEGSRTPAAADGGGPSDHDDAMILGGLDVQGPVWQTTDDRTAGLANLADFRDALVELGLAEKFEVDAIVAEVPATEGVPGLAHVLQQAGLITRYQAAAIYQRKGRGLLIGDYLILDRLGGGVGGVFKARHRRLGRVVALKILPPSFARDATAVQRFRREIEAAGRLKHPHVVAVRDIDEDRGVHFLVMEYVEGNDLDRVVRERGPLTIVQAIDYVTQAARGLEALHAQGIIHRNIKPSNLKLDATGVVRVLDLGQGWIGDASNPFGGPGGARLTESATDMATAAYMAPEQVEDSRLVDHRSDIYGLGCTLYFLLTGRAPFSGDTILKRLLEHTERPRRRSRPRAPTHRLRWRTSAGG